jgi:hypothetical protein
MVQVTLFVAIALKPETKRARAKAGGHRGVQAQVKSGNTETTESTEATEKGERPERGRKGQAGTKEAGPGRHGSPASPTETGRHEIFARWC